MNERLPVVSTLLGDSPAFRGMSSRMHIAARAQKTTLLLGQTGTGKDELARSLHLASCRSSRPFVPVHCAALPDTLIESEMFGHSRGAFTGAAGDRAGLVRSARGGTLFLDEVDSLPLGAQAKLLRFLEAGEYRAVGSDKVEHSDAWVIAASNRNLDEWTQQGRFRRDLMYRLSVVTIQVPSLAERGEDILLLAEHFLRQVDPERAFSAGARRAILEHGWPGNIRELKHRVEAAALFSESGELGAEALGLGPQRLARLGAARLPAEAASSAAAGCMADLLWKLVTDEGLTLQDVIDHCESTLLQRALQEENQNRTRVAQRLGMHIRTLFKKLALLRESGLTTGLLADDPMSLPGPQRVAEEDVPAA
jgi:DNA-binding NtrC family response regulator